MGEKLTRRGFLKAAGIGAALIPSLKAGKNLPRVQEKPKAILVDVRRCVGCKACQAACKLWNNLPAENTEITEDEYTNPTSLSAHTWNYIRFSEVEEGEGVRWVMASIRCMHCLEPTCVSVCPTRALWKREDGPVLYDVDRCIGCRYCVTACPFGIPHFDEEAKAIRKCTMCFDRLDRGLKPACVSSCPTGALDFDLRSRIVRRVLADGRHVYGLQEAGGTSVIYVSSIPFEELGFPRLSPETPARFSSNLLAKFFMIGLAGLVIASALYGAYRLFLRRVEAKSRSASTKPLERRMTIL